MRPTARGLPTTLRTTRLLLLLGSSGEPPPPAPRAPPCRLRRATTGSSPPPGLVPTATPRPRHRLREAATAKRPATHRPRPAGRHPLPHHGGCPPGTTATASRLGPLPRARPRWKADGAKPGTAPAPPVSTRRPRVGCPRPPPPTCPARPGSATGKRRAGARGGTAAAGSGSPPADRQAERRRRRSAGVPPLAAASGGRPPSARQGEARERGRNAAQRGAAPRRRRGGPAAAQRAPTAGTRHPGAVSPRSRRGRPFRGRQAGYGRPHRGLHRDRTAERRGQRDPSPARLPAGTSTGGSPTEGLGGRNSRPPCKAPPPGRPPGSHRAARVFKPPPGSTAFDPRACRGRAAEARTLGTWPWGEGNDLQAPRGCLPRCRPRGSVRPRGRARHPPPPPRPPFPGPGVSLSSPALRPGGEPWLGPPAGAGRSPAGASPTRGGGGSRHTPPPPPRLPRVRERCGRGEGKTAAAPSRRRAPTRNARRPVPLRGRPGCSAAARHGAGRVAGDASRDPGEDPLLSRPAAPVLATGSPLPPARAGSAGGARRTRTPAAPLLAHCRPRSDRGRPSRPRGPRPDPRPAADRRRARRGRSPEEGAPAGGGRQRRREAG